MNARRRTIPDGLPNRVYPKSGSWYWFPKGGRWIKLCRIEDGARKMHERLAAEMKKREGVKGTGNIPALVDLYIEAKKSEHREKGWSNYGNPVKKDFANADIEDADTAAVARFLRNNWADKLSMQRAMRAFMSGFFQWCREEGYYDQPNPVTGMRIVTPRPRQVYIPNDHFEAIREKIDTPMILCLVDLCYLTLQRSTEIRDLRWRKTDDKTANWVDRENGVIHFVPSKTRESSGIAIDWPITDEIEAVLERARTTGKIKSPYVVHNRSGGQWINTHALRVWQRACRAAGLEKHKYTIKDIRAKAMTDAKAQGYEMDALMVAAAHSDIATTKVYMKDRKTPLSNIHLKLPKTA
ncbi:MULTISPECIES: tyrosine-type recombinase/integrase [unclassified Caballeronia]|uniref:tyrosine-type recombinase/integrase n=1 Tax=unclassified Caballeronia TaxID=2646786 RepID=UPI001F159F5C|nr:MULTISPECIES: tyrosine-type recombinase/integrase [unclassified Caballeronia]MCE4544638.1 tyrosine-type recombinase/integrase [Caballeronia sp. PC1]MCE4571789.1 tyrosine-type recombinase/integrase [Caballeronia sp. CLC5]